MRWELLWTTGSKSFRHLSILLKIIVTDCPIRNHAFASSEAEFMDELRDGAKAPCQKFGFITAELILHYNFRFPASPKQKTFDSNDIALKHTRHEREPLP